MLFVMYGVVLLFIAVAAAAMKEARVVKAAANPKSK
jgi:hypothetical protein